ncbi:InlB B-repeat-containing protein [Anaeromyxobacter terrae]|uniref:InlB B-repeat-containing protein n=1 Tax=Anaeromyxobacter terrae TaxID=2925406 RepID=UPI001F57804B|nr:hypothetical protein [Anaeromyxobacter sp. SG22]
MSSARGFALVAVALAAAACGGGGKNGGDGTPQPVSYAVRIALTGPGAVDVTGDATGRCEATCSLSAKAGGQVVLTPVPGEGATFKGFGGACSGIAPCTLDVNADLDVTGIFEATPAPAEVTLTIERTGDGQGAVTSDPAGVACQAAACSGTFASGTRVTLTATPDADSRFEGWDGGGCSGTGTCEVVLTAATTVSARFAKGAPGTYALKILSYPGGTLYAAGIDASGDVAGTFSASTCCESQVFLYDAAADRVTLPLPDHTSARSVAMNDAGMLLVMLEDGKTYRFQDGILGTPLGPMMTAQALNVRGWAAGWVEVGPGPLHAALDDGTAVRDLDPDGTVPSTASGLDAEGRVVGTRNGVAVVFEASGPRALPVPPASSALDVSDTGLVVGAAKRTFKWTEQAFVSDLTTGAVTLIDHPSGTVGMSLDHVNRTGTIAVGQLFTSDGAGDAFVYRSGKVEPLGALVQLPDGTRILNAVGVNDRGQVVVSLRDTQGTWTTAILTPR